MWRIKTLGIWISIVSTEDGTSSSPSSSVAKVLMLTSGGGGAGGKCLDCEAEFAGYENQPNGRKRGN